MGGENRSHTEVVIAGGGLAGLVTAYELLDQGRRVLLIDKDTRDNFGGLARESFGGVHMIGTPHQRRLRIQDSPELAWQDWQSVANYDANDRWPREWAGSTERIRLSTSLSSCGIRRLRSCRWSTGPNVAFMVRATPFHGGTSPGARDMRSCTGC